MAANDNRSNSTEKKRISLNARVAFWAFVSLGVIGILDTLGFFGFLSFLFSGTPFAGEAATAIYLIEGVAFLAALGVGLWACKQNEA